MVQLSYQNQKYNRSQYVEWRKGIHLIDFAVQSVKQSAQETVRSLNGWQAGKFPLTGRVTLESVKNSPAAQTLQDQLA